MRSPLAIAIVCLVAIPMVYTMFESLIDSLVEGVVFQPTAGAELAADSLGIDAEDVYLASEDGLKIHAFYYR